VINYDFPLNVADYIHRAGKGRGRGALFPVLRNLNRRNRNFFAVANENRNLFTDLSGPGTGIKWNHKSSH
jgi:hypothetical protein